MSRFSIKSCLLILAFMLALSSNAQHSQRALTLGDQLYEQGEFLAALNIYQKALNEDSTNTETLYKYGKTLSRLNEFKAASRYLLKSSILGGRSTFDDLSYELAECYRRSGDYHKALRHYRSAIRPYRRNRDSYWYKKIIQSESAAEWANNQEKESKTILNFGEKVNSEASDYAATINGEKIYFTTINAAPYQDKELKSEEQYFNKIFTVDLKRSSDRKELKFEENHANAFKEKHLANISFGMDNTVYFSACDTNYHCEIWQAKLTDNKLINPTKLNKNINHPSSNNTQAYFVIHNNKKLLYFVSNREGGFGGLDLWVSEKAAHGFDKAVNLGNEINTAGNEITPFYDLETQTLYFSSDWHIGFGGYDIFSATGSHYLFKNVKNLQQPINSYYNDYYFQTYTDSALFSSNRKEGNIVSDRICCNDIFKLQVDKNLSDIEEDSLLTEPPAPKKPKTSLDEIEVNVEILNQYLPLSLYFHNDTPDPNSRDTATKENYLKLAYAYADMQDEYLDEVERSTKDEAQIENIHRFFERQHKQGISSLERFMPLLSKELANGSKITLTIKGFSSSLSESDYNYVLALRRIESLINYMKSYRNAALLPYINNTASNGGSLSFEKIPYGDFAIKNRGFENKTMAVYGEKAALQRKIEVIAVNKSEKTEGELSFNATHYKIGKVKKGETLQRFFEISNNSNTEVVIYNVNSNCDCASVEYPTSIKSKEKARIVVNIATEALKGDVKLNLIVVTNSRKNLHNLELDYTVVE